MKYAIGILCGALTLHFFGWCVLGVFIGGFVMGNLKK